MAGAGVPRLWARRGVLTFVSDGLFSFSSEEGKFRAPARGSFFICLRRVTFFSWRKKVTKERHLRKGGFRFPPFLKNLFPLKRPNGEGLRPLPFGNPHPEGFGDYQIAPLPRCGKGRCRPLAAVLIIFLPHGHGDQILSCGQKDRFCVCAAAAVLGRTESSAPTHQI